MSSSAATPRRSLRSLPPTETLEIGNGLSLSPRLKLLLTFLRADLSVKPIDEWKLKQALLSFLRSSPLSLPVSDDDLLLRRATDLHKRKRDEPVASGTLYVRDLSFLKPHKSKTRGEEVDGEEGEDEEITRNKFVEWRSSVIDRLSGIELNIEGIKFKMIVEIPFSDDFEKIKKSWEDYYGSQLLDSRSSVRGVARRPDTIIVRGIPSRWFAEPRVSSKASMLVTHTIFSVFGRIRNINVASDDDQAKQTNETKGDLVAGLNCKVWAQFETFDDFYNSMRVLCGRSMQKEGSRLKVDYEVTWDRENFFRNVQQKPNQSKLRERESASVKVYNRGRDTYPVHPYKKPMLHADSDNNSRRKRFRD